MEAALCCGHRPLDLADTSGQPAVEHWRQWRQLRLLFLLTILEKYKALNTVREDTNRDGENHASANAFFPF